MNTQASFATLAQSRLRHWPWLVLSLVALAIAFIPLPTGEGADISRDLGLTASQYSFSPGVIKVNHGDQVTIELTSTDVVHGLYLDGYDLEITADPGQTTSLSFNAANSGNYRFRCSVPCGPLHPFMIGKLKVGNNTLLWRSLALAVLAAVIGLWSFRR